MGFKLKTDILDSTITISELETENCRLKERIAEIESMLKYVLTDEKMKSWNQSNAVYPVAGGDL